MLRKHDVTEERVADAAVSFQYFCSEDIGKLVLACLQLDVCM